jgi:hypothetical protein
MIKFRNAMVACAAVTSFVGATAGQAAVRPQAVSMRVAPVTLSAKPTLRADAPTQNTSKLAAGLPLILALAGAAAVVAVATSGDSSTR